MKGLTIKAKLSGGFGFLLIMLLAASLVGLNYLSEMNKRLNSIADISARKIILVAKISQGALAVSRAEKNIILASGKEEMDRYARFTEDVLKDMKKHREELRSLADKEGRELLNIFVETWDKYVKVHRELRSVARQTVNISQADANTRAFDLSGGKARELSDRAIEQIAAITGKNEKDLWQDKIISDKSYSQMQTTMILMILFSLASGTGIFLLIISGLTRSLNQAINIADTIAQGNTDIKIEVSAKDEIGKLLTAMGKMTQMLKELGIVAEKIAQGDLSTKVDVKGENDLVAVSINKMVDSLAEFVSLNEIDGWLKTGQNRLNEQMRGDLNEKELADNIITFLAAYLNAQVATLYVAENQGNTLRLAGSYAFTMRKDLNNRIKIGQGLAGQAAYEKKMISVTGIPQDYTRISSSIGNAKPNNILLIPFLLENRLIGVMEFASFHEFSQKETDFLNNIMESVAISFNSVQTRMRTNELLKKTQVQAEELEQQSEELKTSNEELEQQSLELKALNEELEEKAGVLEIQKKDIEQKNREVEQKAEEVVSAGKYKSEFLANMSHELRTPLNSLLLLSGGLSRNPEQNLTSEQVEFLEIIHNSGNDQLQLINEILDLSKIEAGMMEINFKSVSIQEIADSMERKFKHVAEAKDLELKISIDQDMPDSIVTDKNRLEQITTNLISNAVKFTHKGSITINFSSPGPGEAGKAGIFPKSGLKTQETIAIAVTDTGIGIEPEKKQIIFEAFQQADGRTARKYGGTGLGLSISRELAALLGGEIQVQSIAGQGSTFTIYLPVTAKIPAQAKDKKTRELLTPISEMVSEIKTSKTSKTDTSAYTVQDDRENLEENDAALLIIEDDPKFAEILSGQCRSKGFKSLATPNGAEGLKLAAQYLPNGIILDLHLPDIDGRSILTALKENIATRHIPVHILSVDEKEAAVLQQGAIGFLTKPVNQEELDRIFLRFKKLAEKHVKELLVVEDDEPSQKAIMELIGNNDVKITGAADGQKALELLQSGSFDCMLLDLKLPDMTGFELLELIKKEKEIQIPPIIVYRAYA
ncbi:response regulator [Desulfobacterales bacterium HSG17]|nr:response regulator [Desulfobacterales bacterium HSG17]